VIAYGEDVDVAETLKKYSYKMPYIMNANWENGRMQFIYIARSRKTGL
jgi:hypothetical protein